ncbi:MAG: FAD-dependent oxidoreductase [Reyranellaceae bacterium]
MSGQHLVIVGAGHAAGQLIASLAQEKFAGAVTVVGDEPYPPYQRPPLSKKFLAGELALDRLYLKPMAFYEKLGTRLLLGRRAARVDRPAHRVVLDDGSSLDYTTLVLATGSRARALSLPGADLPGIASLRSIADVEAIRARLSTARSLVVVGGGYIGLELAAVAVKLGLSVTVLEQAPRLMMRGVGPVVSSFYERLHREEGVTVHTGVAVQGFEGEGRVERVACETMRIAADLVVVGVGALPNIELAKGAGLATTNGIDVDARCRTEDPAIYAIGDCTNQHHPLLDRRLRLESVHNALEQGRMAAAAICGLPAPPDQVPWFWSDQYDVKLQTAGLSDRHDQAIVRGRPDEGRSFAVFYLSGGVLTACDAMNRPAEFMMSKVLVGARARVDAARLADERVAVKDCRI